MGFNRQLSAAVALASPLEKMLKSAPAQFDSKRASPELIRAITAMDENIDRAMINGDVNRGHRERVSEGTSTADLCAQAVPFFTSDESGYDENGEQLYYDQESIRDTARLALNKYGSFEGLNASQRLAVEGAATNRLTLVQGPPGTGKTAVAIRIMQHWARLAQSECLPGESPKPILATSDSNIAVDNLVEGCANV
jgi:Cdc6-like AAA superfamily ATPase